MALVYVQFPEEHDTITHRYQPKPVVYAMDKERADELATVATQVSEDDYVKWVASKNEASQMLEELTAPTAYSLNGEELENHLQMGDCENFEDFKPLIRAAEEYIEHRTGRAVMEQQVREQFDSFPANNGDLCVSLFPLSLRTSPLTITYWDEDNAQQTFASTNYTIYKPRSTPPVVKLNVDIDWPDTYTRWDAVQLDYWAGYQSHTEVNERVKKAVALMVDNWYEHRNPVLIGVMSKELELSVGSLIQTLKIGNYAAA